MENPQGQNNQPKQLCTITIVFPVQSDDEAIAVKRKIGDAVSNIDDARIDFRIMSLPEQPVFKPR